MQFTWLPSVPFISFSSPAKLKITMKQLLEWFPGGQVQPRGPVQLKQNLSDSFSQSRDVTWGWEADLHGGGECRELRPSANELISYRKRNGTSFFMQSAFLYITNKADRWPSDIQFDLLRNHLQVSLNGGWTVSTLLVQLDCVGLSVNPGVHLEVNTS